ncbi:hypothetical protein [Acaryochloris sp. IP29b_bin.148]|uniref:hypothetical protein n=1 Tax=Acaryochloris sp. IP29b_bin.148 TaxID=2969218 RepID=UPI002603EC82|nr:hypothetical protein [Acaryochloris sp. IP29b_bin.148]
MPNRLLYPLLITTLVTGAIAPASPATSEPSFHLAKKEEKPPDALVTEVEILKENLADTWFYTLRGSLKNQSEATILTPLVYYEIYSETTDRIVEAGTVTIEPKVLPAGEVGTFQKELNTDGRIRITRVQWQQGDKSVKSHKQLQFFPVEAETSEETEAPES